MSLRTQGRSVEVAPTDSFHSTAYPTGWLAGAAVAGESSILWGTPGFRPRFGADYLESIPVEQRRSAGQVYTPEHLAHFILEVAGYTANAPIEKQVLLDPACGAGVFLVAALRTLVECLAQLGVDRSTAVGQSMILHAVARNLYGVDLDPKACELTRGAVRRELTQLFGAPVAAKFFERNVVCADYLLGLHSERVPRHLNQGANFIVGNPPYVPTSRITLAYKERLRQHFETASGRFDLYTLFIERSLGLLSDRGRMAFITPNKFLVSVTSGPLRSLLLSRGAIRTIVNFRSHRVFSDAATVPCITVFERGGKASAVSLIECHDRLDPNGGFRVLTRGEIDIAHLGNGPWHVTGRDLRGLADAIRGSHAGLEAFASRVSAGIATGCDGIYVLPRHVARAIEPDLVRPVVRGRDLAAFMVTDSGRAILIPYGYDSSGRPHLVDLARYPKAHAYLNPHRAMLEKRHCCRVWEKAWYDVHDPIPSDLARQPKILVPDIARSNRFAFDPGQYCPLHSVYYIIPKGIDALYLTAVLNSQPIEFLIRLLAPIVKDGFSRYRRQFLLGLPVPQTSVANMVEIAKAASTGDRFRVEKLVRPLFGLSLGEQKAIDRFLSDLITQQRRPRMPLAP